VAKKGIPLADKILDTVFERTLHIGRHRAKLRALYFTLFFALALWWARPALHSLFILHTDVKKSLVDLAFSLAFWLLLGYLPYAFGKYLAARYVEDIYELSLAFRECYDWGEKGFYRASEEKKLLEKGIEAAYKFLDEAAFACGYQKGMLRKIGLGGTPRFIDLSDVLFINGGEVHPGYRCSSLLWVGGPGYLFIGTDSAALFELPDGSWRVFGPTRGLQPLQGFERLRRVVSLRPHTSRFEVHARTRDGIRLTARDIRVLYRIYSGSRPSTHAMPYPFMSEAVRALVLNEMAVEYEHEGKIASSLTLASTMERIAKSEIKRFIQSQTLVQLLTSILPPKPEMLEDISQEEKNRIASEAPLPAEGEDLGLKALRPSDLFPHTAIAERFNELVNGVDGEIARRRGVGIKWIGVGTFDPPIERIPERHFEAWRLSVENMMRQSPVVLERLKHRRWAGTLFREVRELIRAFQTKRAAEGTAAGVRAVLEHYRMVLYRAIEVSDSAEERERLRKALEVFKILFPHSVEHSPEQADD